MTVAMVPEVTVDTTVSCLNPHQNRTVTQIKPCEMTKSNDHSEEEEAHGIFVTELRTFPRIQYSNVR